MTPDLRELLLACAMRSWVYAAIASAYLAMPPCRCLDCSGGFGSRLT